MSLPIPALDSDTVYTVTALTAELKELLEGHLGRFWLTGEISNLRPHRSGHIYLTLKDDSAQIAAVIWRSSAARVAFELEDGLEVLVQGRIGLYEPQGKYQIVVERIQPKGLGPLELAFRQLREKLEKEGLFAPERKRPLPRFPRRVVLITSPSGAAVRDILQVMNRRWRDVEVWICPVRVQGDGAAAEVASAIQAVNRVRDVDVMVVARGGGSLEDLWAFNQEIVARAIFDSRIPVVSAIGHEIDLTIADLVADRRALTPSEAAELIVPNEAEFRELLRHTANRLVRRLLDRSHVARSWLERLGARRAFLFPLDGIERRRQQCDDLSARLNRAVRHRVATAQHRMARQAAALEGLSPLSVLARGYSLTMMQDGETVVRDSRELAPGDRIVTRLCQGRLVSRVEETS